MVVHSPHLASGLCRSVLLTFQLFGDFPDFFLLLISNLISRWSENRRCTISALVRLWRRVLWLRIWSASVNVPSTLEMDLYADALLSILSILVYKVGWHVVPVFYALSEFLYLSYQLSRRGVEVSKYKYGIGYFSFQFYQLLLCEFCETFFFISSITRIVVSSWWMNCSIHAMTLLISGNIPCSELCLILIQQLWLSFRLGLTSICFPCFHFKPTGTLLYIQGKFLYRLIDTDNKVMVTRWRRSRGEGWKRERIKKKNWLLQKHSHRDVKYLKDKHLYDCVVSSTWHFFPHNIIFTWNNYWQVNYG